MNEWQQSHNLCKQVSRCWTPPPKTSPSSGVNCRNLSAAGSRANVTILQAFQTKVKLPKPGKTNCKEIILSKQMNRNESLKQRVILIQFETKLAKYWLMMMLMMLHYPINYNNQSVSLCLGFKQRQAWPVWLCGLWIWICNIDIDIFVQVQLQARSKWSCCWGLGLRSKSAKPPTDKIWACPCCSHIRHWCLRSAMRNVSSLNRPLESVDAEGPPPPPLVLRTPSAEIVPIKSWKSPESKWKADCSTKVKREASLTWMPTVKHSSATQPAMMRNNPKWEPVIGTVVFVVSSLW